MCGCGCGEPAPIAKDSCAKRGRVKGQPLKYVHGHNRRKSGVAWIEQDCGYKTPCWVWQRSKNDRGYGTMMDPRTRRVRGAHRIIWEQHNGPTPEGLRDLDHLCRNPSCVNPAHLEAVTQTENIRRALSALSMDDAREIRRRTRTRRRGQLTELAHQYGVSLWVVSDIVRGKSYKEAA